MNALKPDEDKVSYSISISVPDIIAVLHEKAIVTAQTKAKDIRIVNSAIESDGKTAKLNSAGQHIVSVLSTQKDGKVKKSGAIAALKEYVKWFAGPDLESKVSEKTVMSLEKDNAGDTPATDDSQPDGQQSSGQSQKALDSKDDEKQLKDAGSDQNASKNQRDNDGKTSGEDDSSKGSKDDVHKLESIGSPVYVKSFRDFLVENCGMKFLLEENGLTPSSGNTVTKKDDDSKDKKDDGKDPEASGWYIGYDLKVKGLKESKIKDALKSFVTTWFDGLTLTSAGLFGGSATISGKDIRKGIHDLRHIDHEKLAQDVRNYIEKKYPNTENATVLARDKDTLLKDLADAGAHLDAGQKKKIASSDYSLMIKVKEEDPKKPFFNVKNIADIIKRCIRLGKKHTVSPDDIIKIESFKDDNDAQSMSSNASRPSSEYLQNIIQKAKDKCKDAKDYALKKKSMFSASIALDLFASISNKFHALLRNQRANQEKENKRAIELFNELKKQYQKESSNGKAPVSYKMFDGFLTKYKKFETGLEESVLMKLLTKRDVVQLLVESLFDEMPASAVLEADDELRKLGKVIEEDNDNVIDTEFTDEPGEHKVDDNGNIEDKKEDVKREEAKPDFSKLSESLKTWCSNQMQGVTCKSAVKTKDSLKRDFKLSYEDDIGKLDGISRKYVAVVDLSDRSTLSESLQHQLMSMLFEGSEDEDKHKKSKHDNDNVTDAEFTMTDDSSDTSSKKSDDSKKYSYTNDKNFKRVQHIFNEFTKDNDIRKEDQDNIIVLEARVSESSLMPYDNMGLILERRINAVYRYIESNKLSKEEALKPEHVDAMRKLSHQDDTFVKGKVKKYFEELDHDNASSSTHSENAKSEKAEEGKKEDVSKQQKPADSKKDDSKQDKVTRAYVLPFDYYKDVDRSNDSAGDAEGSTGNYETSSEDDAGDVQMTDKVDGTDLYIFPIKTSKMFQKTAGNDVD